MRRPLAIVATALAVSMTLSGCVLLPLLRPPQQPQQTPVAPNGDPIAEGPEGWQDLEPCDPSDRWVWIEGFPAEQMEAAGLVAECGGTYFERGDLPTYVSAGDMTVDDSQVAALRAGVESLGFAETDSTFVQPDANSEPGQPGSWQYELNRGDPDRYEVIYVLTYWHGDQPATYDVYVDYESPATRALQL